MDWRKEAVNDLKQYARRKAALVNLAEDIRELKARTYGSTAPATDAVPVQGGTSTAEGWLIAAIDELDRKREAYHIAKRQVDSVERGLATLTEQQRDLLDKFFIHRTSNNISDLLEKFNVEQAQIYRLKDEALRSFTLARYGVLEL